MTTRPPDPKATGSSVKCVVCGRRKAPSGRAVPVTASMCDRECRGYDYQPLPGDLWPGETREDFGYPCSTATELAGCGPVWPGDQNEVLP